MQPTTMNASGFVPGREKWQFLSFRSGTPVLSGAQALVNVAHCGVCGSDVRRFIAFQSAKPSPSDTISIAGHEFVGVIEEVNEDSEFNCGDWVAINPLIGCGVCENCQSGDVNFCRQGVEVIGYHRNGGFAEFCCVPLENLIPISATNATAKNSFLARMALAEPMAVAVNAATTAREFGSNQILVVGDGTIGVLTAWVLAEIFGIDTILLGRRKTRLSLAKKMGLATLTSDEPLPTSLSCVVVASGSQSGLRLALNSLEKTGALVFLGYLLSSDPGLSADELNSIVRQGKTITGSFGYSRDCFRQAVKTLETASFDEQLIVDRVIGLQELPQAMADLVERKVDGFKILVDPSM